jgi:hypothetical protein
MGRIKQVRSTPSGRSHAADRLGGSSAPLGKGGIGDVASYILPQGLLLTQGLIYKEPRGTAA